MPNTSKLPLNIQNATTLYLLAGVDRDTGQVETVFVRPYRDPTHRGDNWAFVEIAQFTSLNGKSAAEVMLSSFRPIPWLDWTYKFMSDSTKKMLGIGDTQRGLAFVGKEYADVTTGEKNDG